MKFEIEDKILEKYSGTDANIIVPDGIEIIGKGAFENNNSVMQIKLPPGLTEIGADAFHGCKNLQEINIPDSVKTIGQSAFCGCEMLERITLPEELSEISSMLFWGCRNLQEIIIPQNVKRIGGFAFDVCYKLTKIVVPENAQLEWFAFSGLDNTKYRIYIPASIEQIEPDVFKDCEAIIIAPHLSLKGQKTETKRGLVLGFAESQIEGISCTEERKAEYNKYIKTQRKNLYPLALRNTALLKYMFSEKLIAKEDQGLLYQLIEKEKRNHGANCCQASDEIIEKNKAYFNKEENKHQNRNSEDQQSMCNLSVKDAKESWKYVKKEDGSICITSYKGGSP